MATDDYIASIPAADLASLVQKCRNIARKMVPADADQAESDAMLGLAKALKAYNPESDASLYTYAVYRVRGEVLDGLRGRDHLSRADRQKVKAGEIDPNVDAVYQYPISIQAYAEAIPNWDLADSGVDWEKVNDEVVLSRRAAAIWTLIQFLASPRDAVIIRRVFLDGETMADVGADCGITESRVCQIVKRVVEKVREEIGVDAVQVSWKRAQQIQREQETAA